ncbi:MAG: bifunctional 4-hydroxy-2-oxoglutarate aldolase/2-dehydro-3-deoxy-phosphogluconate aldolase [Chloroflexota bacterium]
MTINETATRIRQAGIIAIIRGDFPLHQLLTIAQTLSSSNISVLEITLNSENALDGITLVRKKISAEVLVGAGTVRTKSDVDDALNAGAQFIVSPNFDPASVARTQEADVLHLPGIFTATEAQAAYAAGCDLVKLFPADALGPSYLKALRAPLDQVGFVPTGGITADNLGSYIQAGAVAFGVGSSLVSNKDSSMANLADRATKMNLALKRAREAAASNPVSK